ncbi:PREDICTED: interferon-induced very large GTPase 1-like [Bison bison bison]|uniref:Interferon-induced very large GTPase 1-like n=1 Tax=Bison bison bison TaxID=43346 RepID=A0A6P3IX26_BISBB|nr:PREDICTED: interferon-induced very large GTPase 1-like [Bison bison bison]
MKEFTSSQEESMFTQTLEKLGFSITALAKGGGWGISLEAGMDQSMHSESKKIQQSHSTHSYFCSTKFIYIPLASCIFPIDQLQLSNAALQELKYIEDLLGQSEDPDKLLLLRHRTEAFFQRFGSHADQGPLHLGGIYWWKAISEGFQKEQLAEVKQQAAEALDIYIRGSYSGFGVNIGTGLDMSDSHSKKASQRTTFQNLQTKVQLSVAQTGGPPEANGFFDWKAGLVANNQTWCVIDRGLQLVPVWDIVLSSHRSDFKDPHKLANCLKDDYTVLTELNAQIQEREELLSIEKEARIFLQDVKSWKVFDPEEQLKRLINFMQRLRQKTESYTIWTNICLKDRGLQNFLVNTVNFCKNISIYETKFIKSQLSHLLDPHIYVVRNFLQVHSIMEWIFQSELKEDNVHINQFSDLIEILKKTQNDLRDVKANSKSTELVEEAQRKLTNKICLEEVIKELQSVFHEKKERHDSHDNENKKEEVIENRAFQDLLQRLGLEYYYPRKMSRADFQLIHKTSVKNTQPCSERELPFYFLQKLLMLDYGLRYLIIKHEEYTENQVYSITSNQEKEAFDPYEDLLEESVSPTKPLAATNVRPNIHPMDIQMAILHCADDFARQYILDKLSVCQFALPLLIPNPCNAQIEFSLWSLRQIRRSWQQVGKSIKEEKDNYTNQTNRELTTTIRRLLELSNTALSLENCAQVARKQGMLIDEDQRDCKEAKEKAEALMTLLREMEIPQVKENLLPLQGKLWQLWCKKDKELYHLREKGNRSIEQHKSETETEKQKIRHKQLRKAFPLNALMRPVLEILQNLSETHTKLYFLQWLNVALDNLTAGHLENLNEKKKALVLKKKEEAPKSSSLKDWQKEIEAISREINDCTLGIEHILREAGQIYEALEEASSQTNALFLSLPQMAADLMISGAPIELMDGDVSYVPLRWVAAVFDKLSEKLGNKRLFVLSVLGLQSSGKSTLLNALFGLQFTVSAGRCTRGAYMQLLKVEETFTAELGFDFVLVVDTEGLRAPELSNKSQKHDNELATFVIGLGSLTLINIMGENPSEMQDILQIVVQAFMRMKQVKISPSCLFVHQNVGEVTANDDTMDGRKWLEQRLDKMAAIAAEEEQCSDVTCFSDVIKFDVNTHVYYFAHLWDGNPPMAPPNPRYSHNVQELRNRILVTAQQESRGSIMKISDVKFRVQDLWRALLNENFIFSFRNTQEVMAMSKLETMYNSWTWELRSHVQRLQDQLINQIQNGKIQALETYTLEAQVTEIYEAIKQKLEKYVNEDPDSQVLVQWKGNFENKLITLKEALILDVQSKAKELIHFKKNQEKLDSKKSGYEKELLEKSRNLALSLNGTKFSEEELHEKFNPLWEKWVYDVSSSLPPATEPEIEVDSENILLEYFKKEKDIRSILQNYSGEKFEINYDKHIKMNRKSLGLFTMTIEPQDKHSINMTTDCIISKVNETVNKICQQKHDYNLNYFYEILRIIEEEVKSPTQKRYTFTRKYEIDLSLCLFQTASVKFREMHKAFKRANDPVNYLQSKKDDFFMSFKISCQGASSIKTFVDFLWKKLTPAVSSTIRKNMALKIAGDIRTTCRAFNENRANLEKHILISLAEEENFDNYWQYLHNPESFFKNYIENHVKRYFSDTGSEKIKTFLQMSLDDIKNAILSAIHVSTAIAKDKSSTVSGWLDLFCDHLGSTLIFPRKDLISIEHQEIKDIEFIKEAMSKALDPEMKKVEQNCLSKLVEEMIPEIQKMLSEHLSGCWKQCPFCKAICTNTIPTHEGDHSVPFHRPEALSGMSWYQTDHFAIDFCTSLVASDYLLILKDGRRIPYKTYRQAGGEYATWSITPDTSTQPYWKWFVCHFRSKLEEKYHRRFINKGEIPDAWNKITKQDVLDDLKKH